MDRSSKSQTTTGDFTSWTQDKSIELNSSFMFQNGDEESSESYTSLRDLIPASSSSPPSGGGNSGSWYETEIPIRNPLVKHAALAYLQPMSTPPEVFPKGVFSQLGDWCFGECGCIGWLRSVASGVFDGDRSGRKFTDN